MKKLLKIFIIIGILVGLSTAFGPAYLYFSRWANSSFCDRPITYAVNNIDPRFDLSRETVSQEVQAAANIWNNLYGQELFIYDEDSPLDINLVYDERQNAVSDISREVENIDQEKDLLTSDIQELERRKKAIAADLNDLNDEIDYWNKRGGAPKDKYNELIRRQRELQNEVNLINKTAAKLNATSSEVNTKIEEINQKVGKFNELLNVKPEEGMYYAGPHQIDIFIYENSNSFQHTVAHELGHALGLGHTEVEDSLMYPVSTSDSGATEADKKLLQFFCSEQNRFDLVENDLRNLVYVLYEKVSILLEE